MNPQSAAPMKNRDYEILNALAEDSLSTQAGLSAKLGMAVGSVNWYIKRLIKRGYVKVSHLDRTRLKYDLTSEGMKVFTQRAIQYMQSSLQVYAEIRNKAKHLLADLASRGISHVYLDGENEVMDILRLTLLEADVPINTKPEQWIITFDGRKFIIEEKNRGNHVN